MGERGGGQTMGWGQSARPPGNPGVSDHGRLYYTDVHGLVPPFVFGSKLTGIDYSRSVLSNQYPFVKSRK